MAFLEDSHKRGVLRQVGPVYQFRHIELQRRLAARVAENSSPTWLQEVTISARWQEHKPGTTLRPFAPLNDKRARRRRSALRITAAVAALAVTAATVTLIDRIAVTRTSAASPQSSSLVPAVACPAEYFGSEGVPPAHTPAMKSAPVTPELGRIFAYYIDVAPWIPMILGPRGWKCSAEVGADGGWTIDIYPQGGSVNGPEVIEAGGPSCIGCVYSAVCPLIPRAAAELSFPGKCSADRTPKQVVSWIVGSSGFSPSGNDVVSIVDPAGVKGYVAHSGGRYAARGILLYFWGLPVYYSGYPSGEGESGALTISCTLPNGDARLCNAVLAAFRQYGFSRG